MKFLAYLLAAISTVSYAQQIDKKSVVIGDMVSRPNALLVINPAGNDQGFLLPQMSTASRNAIQPSSPEENGLLVFDSTEKSFYYWKDGSWIKGLGQDEHPVLSYNAATHTLNMNDSHVDLTSLKEIPEATGMAGRFLTTDGVGLSWSSLSNIGDITSITAGTALSGGSAEGDATLSVETDNTTISVSASNKLQVADKGITSSKILPGTTNTMLSTNASGTVQWMPVPNDSQNLSLAGNILSLTNDPTTVDLGTVTLTGSNISDGTIATNDLSAAAVTPTKVQPGANNTVLSTDATGIVKWSAPVVSPDAQNLSIAGNMLSLTNDATPVDLSNITVTGTNITDGTIAAVDIATAAVTPVKVQPGTINTVLSTDASGVVKWSTPAVSPDAQNLSIAGNILSLTNDGTPVDLSSITLTGTNIATGTIIANNLSAAAVTPTKVQPGAINTVLSTDASGVVKWSTPAVSPDAQNLSIAGNVLSLTNDATPVDLSNITVTGTNITDGTIAAVDIATAAVTPTKVQPGAINTVLSTDASGVVKWSTPAVSPDAQNLSIAGNVLSLTNDATPVDLSNITVTGTNITDGTIAAVDIATAAVTPTKVQPGANNTVLSTDATGIVKWSAPAVSPDAQNLSIAGNILSLTNDATPVDLSNISLTGTNIAAGTIIANNLSAAAITPTKVQPGANNTVLSTDATGIVKWSAPAVSPDAQNLSIAGNVLSLTNDATPVDLSNITVTGSNITDGTISANDLATAAVTPVKVQPGTINTVLSTDASGVVKWSTPAVSPDAQNLSIAGNMLSLTNDATPVDLSNITLTGTNIATGTIIANNLSAAAVTPSKVQPGANNTVLSTDATGIVKWSAPAVSPDAQDLTLSGNILSLTNDATPVNLTGIVASGAVTGPLSNLTIPANTIATSHIQNDAITVAKLGTAGAADAGKVFTTDAAGNPQLELKNNLLTGITAGGDLSGTYPSPTVSKLQGNAVSAGALNSADNGKILVWNGTQWVPQIVPGVTTSSRYLMIDPADFVSTKKDGPKDKDNKIMFEDDNTFVTIMKRNEGSQLIAPLHLDDGVTIQEITLYYWDQDGPNLDLAVYRRSPTGNNENLITPWSSSGSSASIRNSTHTPIVGRNVVNNGLYSYRIVVNLNPDQDVNNLNEADQRVYAVRIKFIN